ncbi:dienelactone hydrolase family protein [Tsukamurella paurometabola]|uniref:Esterase/lipase n=1 Tax=Tsukamurella paurometabola TaxID=2061 RepID=A0A3P8KDK0_TSUPA|nr:dienelactone hydrolase family protein [Tsukamurella paurometabola]UEA85109.1 dienelactone hydrolase family protein [Tsukamurella paurometabola]VDR37718.1 Esterase/lipase [Tsukamurella paurometabola]
MSTVALFHSVLGVREGVRDAAARLRAAGHVVHVVDQYDGRVFESYDEASAHVEGIGFPALMASALAAVAGLPEDLVVMGFSNGGGMATYVAGNRPVARAVLCSGALPLDMIGQDHWPQGVPAQLHYALDDPFRQPGSVESVLRSVGEAGAIGEFLQYPGAGHLFTDPSLPAEFDGAATEAFWTAVLRFIGAANPIVSR